MIQQAKFTYSPLRKLLENKQKQLQRKEKKQAKAIEDHGEQ